ncbi:hypothetical protein HHK36_005599 [Tetracentron sinense]|uniref:Uncharacterized protein n=1 Tax=Tetracentron sinense TaxID=13715 RepID=A0A834ZVP1_TETSI|nr:hypothetical protein HHK36_005599 [Tetracentron sinense]
MFSTSKIKSVDFYRKIPRDLTEASLSGAGLSIIAALSMMFLFGMELNDYLTVSTSTSIVVDKSLDGDFLRIEFNIRLNITKTIHKFSIDPNLKPTGSEFHPGPIPNVIKHGDEADEEYGEGSIPLTADNFDRYAHQYDPELDGRILLGKVDCTKEGELCRRNHIQGYPSVRIFRKGNNVRDDHGHHDHESYYGHRDADSLVTTMENLVAPIPMESQRLALENKPDNTTDNAKRPAPLTGGCRIEGFVRVKKVPGNLVISARSGAHSFDASQMNMSHVISHLSFGKKISLRVLNEVKEVIPYLGGSHDRLNGRAYISHLGDANAHVTIEHYLQIVKTEVISRRSSWEHKLVEEYEYTAHSSLVQSIHIPVAKFHFELSPMQVLVTENPKSFSHFITNVCAIVGGVFTVAGILDSILHNTMRLVKKVELGKNF